MGCKQCELCKPGSFANTTGASFCINCTVGESFYKVFKILRIPSYIYTHRVIFALTYNTYINYVSNCDKKSGELAPSTMDCHS